MTSGEVFALARDVVLTIGVIGGAIGAIGIQKWRVAKLETEIQGMKGRLEIAELTSVEQYIRKTKALRQYYEAELEETRAAIEEMGRRPRAPLTVESERLKGEQEAKRAVVDALATVTGAVESDEGLQTSWSSSMPPPMREPALHAWLDGQAAEGTRKRRRD